jgi:hypothetical protein
MYLAGNRVFALTEKGEQWRAISPDLSAQDAQKIMSVGSGAETYGVVYALAESPIARGMLWAGTDDGKLWVTRDGGGAWTDLTANLPVAAKGQWISRIAASAHEPQTAYLAVSAYRSGNYAPLLYKTADLGKSWTSIAGNLPPDTPVRVVREDPANPALLYVGTQTGLFISLDGGTSYVRFGGLPTVPVDDVAVHPRDRDLVIATHGRSLYIVDDIRPLEELTPAVQAKATHFFPVRPATGVEPLEGWVDSAGAAVFRGANPPAGVLLTVWVKEFTGDSVSVTVADANGRQMAKLSAPSTPGLARLSWNLKPAADVLTTYGGEGANLFARPGEYTLTMTCGSTSETQKVSVTIAPGLETR